MECVGQMEHHEGSTQRVRLGGSPTKLGGPKVPIPPSPIPKSLRRGHKPTKLGNVNKETLARGVADVLELPYEGRSGKAYEAVKAIFTSMIGSLRRGEAIEVAGFGVFKLRTRPARGNLAYFYPYLKKKGLHKEIITLPPKVYVHFQPSKAFLRLINDQD